MSGISVYHLPDEVIRYIFSFLSAEDIGRAASTSRQWMRVAKNRMVWHGKDLIVEGYQGLLSVAPIARALPILREVSISWAELPQVFLSGQVADFRLPELRGEAATAVISALVPEVLSVEFSLLDEASANCLIVQLHRLQQLQVRGTEVGHLQGVCAKLRALIDTLSREPLSYLRSADFRVPFSVDDGDSPPGLSAALATCPVLERLTVCAFSSLHWQAVGRFPRLQFLELEGCKIEDMSFLEMCPKLRSLSLESCQPLRSRELSQKSDLQNLVLRCLSVDSLFVDTLCLACPELQSITLDGCPYVKFLGHCSQLVEVGLTYPTEWGLPPCPGRLSLTLATVTSDELAKIVRGLPGREFSDVVRCNIGPLHFLQHCAGLENLRKLSLLYEQRDVGPLTEVLGRMPQLETLEVKGLRTPAGLSFLRHCRGLHSLTLSYADIVCTNTLSLEDLPKLKQLRKFVTNRVVFCIEELEDFLPSMPLLEELVIHCDDTVCNVSFLRHCRQLVSLSISLKPLYAPFRPVVVWSFEGLRLLERLETLALLDLERLLVPRLVKEVRRMPRLKFLCLEANGANYLQPLRWHEMLSSLK